ncbi:MAG: hypothetical protein ABIR70_21600 [Bryobacteraceae bacterium]
MEKGIAVLVALVVGGAVGYLYSHQQTTQVTNTLEQTKSEMGEELRQLRDWKQAGTLTADAGSLLVEVEQKNFTVARELSTKFFDAVRQSEAAATDPQKKKALTDVLGARDQVTSDLATGSDHSVPKLREVFLSLQQLIR